MLERIDTFADTLITLDYHKHSIEKQIELS